MRIIRNKPDSKLIGARTFETVLYRRSLDVISFVQTGANGVKRSGHASRNADRIVPVLLCLEIRFAFSSGLAASRSMLATDLGRLSVAPSARDDSLIAQVPVEQLASAIPLPFIALRVRPIPKNPRLPVPLSFSTKATTAVSEPDSPFRVALGPAGLQRPVRGVHRGQDAPFARQSASLSFSFGNSWRAIH